MTAPHCGGIVRAVALTHARVLAAATLLVAGWPGLAAAQCPDGAPPPCARPAPPAQALDERTWLVLPFENTARNTSAELIGAAGLNLLYQELSRWSDVRVVSDDRVDDLLRSLPEAQRSPLGLEAGRTLARRVGAGRVVLGDYLAVGSQAQIVAKIYDVRTGRQVRLVRERLVGYTEAAALDSMSATYSRLGAAILGLPPRTGGTPLAGTSSIEAFRAYAEGMASANRGDIPEARAHMLRAIAADSTYALAQVRVAQFTVDSIAGRPFLAAAERHASALPALERAKLSLFMARQAAEACEPSARVLALDSSDADGWIGVSRCENRVLPLRAFPGDGSRRLRGGNPHRAAVAARRALALDPASIFAMGAVWNVYTTLTQRSVCEHGGAVASCPRDSLWVGALVPAGDSAVFPLERVADLVGEPPWLRPEAVAMRRRRFEELRRTITAAEGADNIIRRSLLFRASVALGNLAEAERLVAHEPTRIEDAIFLNHLFRLDLELALERPSIGARVDSALARREFIAGPLAGMMGRYELDAASVAEPLRPVRAAWLPIMAGVLPAAFDSIEAALAAATANPTERHAMLEISTLVAFRMRGAGPALDTAARHPIRRFQALLARGDTARARAVVAGYDSLLARRPEEAWDDGGRLFAAEAHLALGDTAHAWVHMRAWARVWRFSAPRTLQILDQWGAYANTLGRLSARTWLLYADLAASRGTPAEARRGYQMVVNLWAGGDPPVQPLVARARTALASLGN